MTPDPVTPQEVIVPANSTAESSEEPSLITSPEEIEGLHIIRALLREHVNPRRVFMRDAQSYCAILLDDNNRKPICRLRFNNTQRLVIGLFNDTKEEERIPIESVDDLYNYADRLKASVLMHLPTN